MAENEPHQVVICDAGPLIHLDELGCIDLLADYSTVLVPEAVWLEVVRHRPSVFRRRSVKLQKIDEIPAPSERLAALITAFELDIGEVAALSLSQQFKDALLLSDDTAARFVATQLGIEVHGTIGIVVRAIRRGQRTQRQVLNLLKAIPRRSTLFVEERLLSSVIEEVMRNA